MIGKGGRGGGIGGGGNHGTGCCGGDGNGVDCFESERAFAVVGGDDGGDVSSSW